jgi:uncharacterized protein (TIGR02302 family)
MTHLSKPTDFRPGLPTDRVARFVALARTVIALERILPRLLPALGLAGLFLAAALAGLFAFVPWPLHALILAGVVTAIGLLLDRAFADFALPSWSDGARRLERDSALAHRPISEAEDTLAAGGHDAMAQALWKLHLTRRLAQSPHLRAALPHADLQARDPRRLRYGVLALLILSLIVAGTNWRRNLLQAFAPGLLSGTSLEAWVDPPPYTGLAPIYLSPQETKTIAVPVGAILNLHVHGANRTPGLALAPGNAAAVFDGANGEYASAARLTIGGSVRVRAGGRSIGRWNLRIIPDHPPHIAFREAPRRTEHDAVKFSFAASDDYGVVSARAILRPHGRPGKPLIVDLPLPEPSAKSVSQDSYADLTGHPYAGLDMDVTLEATDGAGQKTVSAAVRFKLPARIFTDPLARALIEQRQNLASSGAAGRARVAETLDALTIAPELFYPDHENLYLGIRAAYWAVKKARYESDIEQAENLLWQIASSLEQGGMLAAAQQLRQLQQMLLQALAQGAPQDVIDALLQRYQDALHRYLQSLAQNPSANAPSSPDAKVLGQQDLEALLKAIQQLSQSGDRTQAAQMLALLQNLLENLHMTQGSGSGQGEMSPQDKALSDALGKLGALMGEQRRLMDKTFRQKQGQGDPKDGGPKGLGKQQGQLEDELQTLRKSLGHGQEGQLPSAGQSMGRAQKNLGASDLDNAGAAEKEALEEMRQTADALAKKLASDRQGQNGEEDPLGRATGAGSGSAIKIPPASDLSRARAILQELRKRAAERGRSQQELDYIDRLLKQF